MSDRRGLLIILSSPSGAGKSTLAKMLRDWDDTLKFSVSATTRPARDGEVDGEDYYFLSEDAFKRQVAEGEMLEHAYVFGNFYGSPKTPVQAAINGGTDVLFDVDWQGEVQIRNSDLAPHALSIFLLPPSIPELRQRLEARGKDSADVIAGRMEKSWSEISHWGYYDYVLVNDNLDQTFEELKSIITATRLRRTQQPALMAHVRKLQTEFEELA
ncbi:MAG: guanylate kinase [Rhodobacteraceae bacterium]|nr:guanylate kinase [Paracoccaceae bacterium]